jgi:hypothetical protein
VRLLSSTLPADQSPRIALSSHQCLMLPNVDFFESPSAWPPPQTKIHTQNPLVQYIPIFSPFPHPDDHSPRTSALLSVCPITHDACACSANRIAQPARSTPSPILRRATKRFPLSSCNIYPSLFRFPLLAHYQSLLPRSTSFVIIVF